MEYLKSLLAVSLLVVSSAVGGMAATHSVVDKGAKGDGVTDDSKAFEDTWKAACGDSSSSSTLLVPAGKTFLLRGQMFFAGPCNSPVHVMIDGGLRAPSQPWNVEGDYWIAFKGVDGLVLDGSGEIDGQGQVWWDCKANNQCSQIPNSLYILDCNNFILSGLTFKNSPGKHIAIDGVNGGQVFSLAITAPDESPNTDGIYLQNSHNIKIFNSNIGTGDDCIAIGPYSSYITVNNTACGPGHGISIGSLGSGGTRAEVEQIHVYNCSFRGTQNGVRIKTWQGGSGYTRDITFENIIFTDVNKPIVIDQFYCNGRSGCTNKTSAVQVSDVRYTHLRGTTDREYAIILECSETSPCTGITMGNINIGPSSSGGSPEFEGSVCVNVKGKKDAPMTPEVSCLATA